MTQLDPIGRDGATERTSMPHGAAMYERPRTAWLRSHLGIVIGLLMALISLVIWAIRHWA